MNISVNSISRIVDSGCALYRKYSIRATIRIESSAGPIANAKVYVLTIVGLQSFLSDNI